MQKEGVSDTIIPPIALLQAREYPLRGERLFFFFFLLQKQQEGLPLMLSIFSLGLDSSFPLTNLAETRQQCRAVEK